MKLTTTDIFKRLANNNSDLILLNKKQLKQLQQTILSIADDIIGICEEENINYHLTGGSVLGAIRHDGFIPWDDDLDIDLSREGYNKLIRIINERYADKYYVHYPYNKNGHSIPYVQIRLKNTTVRGCNDVLPDECGAYIDIAIMENTFNNAFLRKIHGIGSMFLGLAVSCKKFNKNRKFLLELAKNDEEAKKIFKAKIFLGKLFGFLTLRRWTIIYDWWNKLCKNNDSKYVVVPTGRNHFFGELYLRKDFYERLRHNFEDRNWYIPKEFDSYLKHMYGNYMEIPVEQEREKHVLLDFKL